MRTTPPPAGSSLFAFLEAKATAPDGSTFDVLLVEDPPGYLRPATAVEKRLRDELNRSRSYRETMEGLPEGTLPRA